MKDFYFTYGTDDTQPFKGGWTKISIPDDVDDRAAVALFRSVHPDIEPGRLNCASMYTDFAFQNTKMFFNGNFGCGAHEVIIVKREGNTK